MKKLLVTEWHEMLDQKYAAKIGLRNSVFVSSHEYCARTLGQEKVGSFLRG